MDTTTITEQKNVHPLWLRLCHWINAIAMFLMVFSGWRIYNASPLFMFSFPKEYTLGGWLGGALQWHFAAMWLFAINGSAYFICNTVTGRFCHRFWPLDGRQIFVDFALAIRGRLGHANLHHYNMVQKCVYLLVLIDSVLLGLSGVVLWKSVQFPLLSDWLGGYEVARYIHFYAMSFICVFIVVHLVMVALVPKTLLAMLRGR